MSVDIIMKVLKAEVCPWSTRTVRESGVGGLLKNSESEKIGGAMQ
jgi:hypothetical protein